MTIDSARSKLAAYLALTRSGSSEFWLQAKRWFLMAAVVGLLVGGSVTVLEVVVGWLLGSTLSAINPVTVVLIPTIGLGLSGAFLQFATQNPETHGTEEVIEAFHERGGVFRFRSFPGKMLAAVATLGAGGSAGLEGPSIYAGGAIGAFLMRKLRPWGFSDEDVRALMVAGMAGGVSAIFKAPLTGIIFALEVPYRDDLTREALIPSLVSAVVSYLVLVQFLGVEPLFHVGERFLMTGWDLLYAILLGLLVGLAARLFVASYHFFGRVARSLPMPLWGRTALGGFLTGMMGLASLYLLGEPAVLGTGYGTITGLMQGAFGPLDATYLLFLKAGATIATLASGAAGGVFIPMIMLGADLGVILRGILPGATGSMFPVVGMAAFLAAGYNTPIAAAVFVAEATGGAGYIIPGLIAAAVAYSVAGRTSVSDKQRWRREGRLDRLLRLRVGDIMTPDVITVPGSMGVEEFVTQMFTRVRHKSLPVLDDSAELLGMVSMSDIGCHPRESWAELSVGDVMTADVLTVTRDVQVGDLVELMSETDIDRVPVVETSNDRTLVGIVSSTDVLALDDVCADWRRRRQAASIVARRRDQAGTGR